MNKKIDRIMLDSLREKTISMAMNGEMSKKRCDHTLEVEKMVLRLADIYMPENKSELAAAALLHDITKELTVDGQIELCKELGVELDEWDICAPKTLHAMSAAAKIKRDYPEFATDNVINYVRWHTTGRAGMTLGEKLVYLADYIDMSRKFDDCVALREFFFEAEPEKMSREDALIHLEETLLRSFDMTIMGLLEKRAIISVHTIEARNDIVYGLFKNKN